MNGKWVQSRRLLKWQIDRRMSAICALNDTNVVFVTERKYCAHFSSEKLAQVIVLSCTLLRYICAHFALRAKNANTSLFCCLCSFALLIASFALFLRSYRKTRAQQSANLIISTINGAQTVFHLIVILAQNEHN